MSFQDGKLGKMLTVLLLTQVSVRVSFETASLLQRNENARTVRLILQGVQSLRPKSHVSNQSRLQ